ncbi:MAG TPA: HEAT repeat domain-containing protein [Methanoregulaceae archaeon]|nr:HEAT repeat domain-containing protein [Methanoregulaceae archaeon]
MVPRSKDPGKRNRIGILLILYAASFLAGMGFTAIQGLGIVFTLAALLSVVFTSLWFGRYGLLVAAALVVYMLSAVSVFFTGSVPTSALISAALILLTGCIGTIVSERMRAQMARELPLIHGEPKPAPVDSVPVGEVLGLAQYCILPYLNVRRMKEKKDVRGLIRALTSDDINLQYNATEALGEVGDPFAINALIHALTRDRYSAIRWKAAEALARIGEPAIGPLIKELGNRNDDVRWKAAIALGDIGDPKAVIPLAGLLDDTDPYVRGRAAYALSAIGQPAVSELVRVLDRGTTNARPSAVAALGRINDPRAIAPLIRALSDDDERVRSEALVALGRAETNVLDRFLVILNEAGAVKPVTGQAGDEDSHGAVTERTPPGLVMSEKDLREYLARKLEETGDPSFKPLIRNILEAFSENDQISR